MPENYKRAKPLASIEHMGEHFVVVREKAAVSKTGFVLLHDGVFMGRFSALVAHEQEVQQAVEVFAIRLRSGFPEDRKDYFKEQLALLHERARAQ